MTNYFAIFGLTPDATEADIKKAYRRLAKKFHPDAGVEDETAMQIINEAKDVLLDPKKREEHRNLLGFYGRLSEAYLESQTRTASPGPTHRRRTGPTPWTKHQKRRFYGSASVILGLLLVAFAAYPYLVPHPKPLPPLAQITERHPDLNWAADDAAIDTITVHTGSLMDVISMAEVLNHTGDFRTATRYWKKALELDSGNERYVGEIARDYFKRGSYAHGLAILASQMHQDSNLVKAYYNLGEIFQHNELPFDAESAYEEASIIAAKMKHSGHPTPYSDSAKEKLSELE